jgi:hypothetical protein
MTRLRNKTLIRKRVFLYPGIATVIFMVFLISPVATWFEQHIPHPCYRVVVEALIFFTVIYIVERCLDRCFL